MGLSAGHCKKDMTIECVEHRFNEENRNDLSDKSVKI